MLVTSTSIVTEEPAVTSFGVIVRPLTLKMGGFGSGVGGAAVVVVSVSVLGGDSGTFWVHELDAKAAVSRQTKTGQRTFFIFIVLPSTTLELRSDTPKFSFSLESCQFNSAGIGKPPCVKAIIPAR